MVLKLAEAHCGAEGPKVTHTAQFKLDGSTRSAAVATTLFHGVGLSA